MKGTEPRLLDPKKFTNQSFSSIMQREKDEAMDQELDGTDCICIERRRKRISSRFFTGLFIRRHQQDTNAMQTQIATNVMVLARKCHDSCRVSTCVLCARSVTCQRHSLQGSGLRRCFSLWNKSGPPPLATFATPWTCRKVEL